MKPCGYFQWTDTYIAERGLDVEVLPTMEPIQSPMSSAVKGAPAVKEEISNTAHDFLVNGELQKLNKHLSKMVELKKQSNMMVGVFYVCLVAIYLVMLFR